MIAWICSHSSPKLPSTRGEKFSSTASLSAISRRSSARPSSVAEIEREVALVGVRAQVVRAALPPRAVHARARAGGAHAVDAADRLDVDHVGAERGERARRDRARPPRGEVEHAHARERQLVGADGREPRRATCGSIVPVCSPRRGRGRGGGGSSSSMRHGRRGILNGPGRVVDEDVAGDEVVAVEDVLAAVHRRHRDAQLAGAAHDLGGRVLRRPRVDDVVPLVPAASGGPPGCANGSPSMRSGRSMSSRKLWNCWRLLVQNPT